MIKNADLSDSTLLLTDLRGAQLDNSNLSGAYLSYSVLSGTDLAHTNLSDSCLKYTLLSPSRLTGAVLTGASLEGSSLVNMDLSDADTSAIKQDLLDILQYAVPEVPGLRLALVEGRVDGTAYRGECACLIGTIANLKDIPFHQMKGIDANPSRAAERFFTGIKEGDRPETNAISALVVQWIDEFVSLHQVETKTLPIDRND